MTARRASALAAGALAALSLGAGLGCDAPASGDPTSAPVAAPTVAPSAACAAQPGEYHPIAPRMSAPEMGDSTTKICERPVSGAAAAARGGIDDAAASAAVASAAAAPSGCVAASAERVTALKASVYCGTMVIAVRSARGEVACYPLVENEHAGGILRRSRAPAPNLTDDVQATAADFAATLLTELDYVGVLAVELFDVGGRLLANEMAPRVHNSGHWTIEGALTSQFENHVRAICGLPLGSTELCAAGVVMDNLIGDEAHDWPAILSDPANHLHLYGKAAVRPGRKMGHVTRLVL